MQWTRKQQAKFRALIAILLVAAGSEFDKTDTPSQDKKQDTATSGSGGAAHPRSSDAGNIPIDTTPVCNIFTVPGSAANCILGSTARGGRLRKGGSDYGLNPRALTASLASFRLKLPALP
ncbi:MAG: hypothetical protein JXA30_16060 [Deltaproteobacteria bacterium]|nr:hypothetical protein [Deltaproteobacteria bacterium]